MLLEGKSVMNKEKIAVLMSTYNGEKYIEEQIMSIIRQSYEGQIAIYVRDDGSKDGTVELIQKLSREVECEKRCIYLSKCDNVGVQKSFLDLIQQVNGYDIYFFADQDDVWKDDKVQRAVSMLNACQDKNKMYCSDYSITDMELKVLYDKQVLIDEKTFNPLRLQFYNVFPGCVMAFNDGIMDILRKMDMSNCMMHDSMALAVAAAIGTICYDDVSTIYHRIHGDNVVGYGHKKIKIFKWIKEKFGLLCHKDDYDVSEVAEKLVKVAKNEIKEKYVDDIILLQDYKKSLKKTIRLFRHKDVRNKISRTSLSIRMKILFHIF